MSNILDGKTQFKTVIKYINDNKINLDSIIKDNISKLIVQWNLKNKNYNDYFKMKEYHSNINGVFTITNPELEKLWYEYIKIAQSHRINLMNKLKSISDAKIEVYINDSAKEKFLEISEGKSLITSQTINKNEHIKLLTVVYNNVIVAYTLLSKNDYDPYNKYTNPYTIDYIYTLKAYRRCDFSSMLLNYIKTTEEVTAFCDNKESENLFKKAGFKYCGLDKILKIIPVYRYP